MELSIYLLQIIPKCTLKMTEQHDMIVRVVTGDGINQI